MKYIATKDCTIQALTADPGGIASYIIEAGSWSTHCIAGTNILVDGAKILVTGLTTPGAQIAPAEFTMASSASKSLMDSKPPLLVGDESDEVEVKFNVSGETVTALVKLTIVSAGQVKVSSN